MAIAFVILVESVVLVSVVLVVECIVLCGYPVQFLLILDKGAFLVSIHLCSIQLTTRTTETSITNPTRITNEMATSSDYLMKYFNGILAILLE